MGMMLCLLICESGYVSNDLSFSREDLYFMVGWGEGVYHGGMDGVF